MSDSARQRGRETEVQNLGEALAVMIGSSSSAPIRRGVARVVICSTHRPRITVVRTSR